MRWNPKFLYAAWTVFLLSTGAVLVSLEQGSRVYAIVGGVGNGVAAVLFGLSLWWPRRKVDWDRIEAEQRLWESGPLGRRWLRVRRRASDRFRT